MSTRDASMSFDDGDIDVCERLLALHLNEAVQRFGAAALGVIDLPPLADERIESGQLRAVAALFWAREVDAAGLLEFTAALAERILQGRLPLTITTSSERLMLYHRRQRERFGPEERAALYGRVFGDEAGGDSMPLFEQMVQALLAIGSGDHSARATAVLAVAARNLAERLSQRSAGITAFAAREILEDIKEAMALLRDREISASLGGGGLWNLLRRTSPMVLGRQVDPAPHLARARAGAQLLSWLAEVAPMLESGRLSVERGSAVLQAAANWQASTGEPVYPSAPTLIVPRFTPKDPSAERHE
jgi:hypothetical protein